MNCGHRLVWLGHWPSMHTSCEVSPQPGTLLKAGIQIPVTAFYMGIHILAFVILLVVNKIEVDKEIECHRHVRLNFRLK